MAKIEYTADQLQQIASLQQYVEAELQKRGIEDDGLYMSALDGQTIDPALLNDPIFQAYWQLTYYKLMEILQPETLQALSAEVGEVDFNTLYAAVDDETNEFVNQLLLDAPELMQFAALTDDDESTDPKEVLAYLMSTVPPASLGEPSAVLPSFTNQEARDAVKRLGLNEDMWDWIISTEEGGKASQANLLQMLADLDQQMFALSDALKTGKIDSTKFDTEVRDVQSQRAFLFEMINETQGRLNTMMMEISKILRDDNSNKLRILGNIGGS